MSREHELKTWPGPFAAILDGRKRFEIRKDDRGFAVGDALHLREWDPTTQPPRYTGREVRARVTYLVTGGNWGLPDALCVMGIDPAASSTAPRADARAMPAGTLVTCEHCPTPHPKDDDGRPCQFPKVAAPAPRQPSDPAQARCDAKRLLSGFTGVVGDTPCKACREEAGGRAADTNGGTDR